MSETTERLLSDAVQKILRDHCSPAVVRRIELGASTAALWWTFEESGFIDALVSESAGGAVLSLQEISPVLELCGRHAVPVPLGETIVARGLLAAAGARPPPGPIAFGSRFVEHESELLCHQVPCGRNSDWVFAPHVGGCRLLPSRAAVRRTTGFVLDAAMTWPISVWRDARAIAINQDLDVAQAAVYAAQLAGALCAVFERTLWYANERQQFGRPIGKFQAIQHQLSVMSEHVFAACMAARVALPQRGLEFDRLKVAVAKARTSEAAVEVAALSHSIHGAIGFTQEYDLQLLTRRLHAWRQAAGSESYWHDVIGGTLLAGFSASSLDMLRRLTDLA